tara:strand:+ start:4151 stop:5422 length:1272 start_codon:yes stop_codon:yes gene_type:complete
VVLLIAALSLAAQGQAQTPRGATPGRTPVTTTTPSGPATTPATRPTGSGTTTRVPRDDRDPSGTPLRIVASEVQTLNGRTEYIAIGPEGEAAGTARTLLSAGATLVRRRAYPGLGRVGQIFVLPFTLSPERARRLVADAAPATRFDAHGLYRYAEGGPRLYAERMVLGAGRCRAPPSRTIGMIDGPVNLTHPALASARVDAISVAPGGRAAEAPDHATAVAALIVGADARGVYAGFAAGARLVAVDAFSGSGRRERTNVDMIGAGLDVLVRSGVRVINLSLSGGENAALGALLAAAAQQGVVMIGAAGNDGRGVGWPAAAPEVIAVTAVDAAMAPYGRANRGPEIEFAAPGVDLWVARRDSGGYASGTSYAAPIVTALAAQLGAGAALSASDLRRVLRASARDIGAGGRDHATGWGLVQASGC